MEIFAEGLWPFSDVYQCAIVCYLLKDHTDVLCQWNGRKVALFGLMHLFEGRREWKWIQKMTPYSSQETDYCCRESLVWNVLRERSLSSAHKETIVNEKGTMSHMFSWFYRGGLLLIFPDFESSNAAQCDITAASATLTRQPYCVASVYGNNRVKVIQSLVFFCCADNIRLFN